LLSSNILLAEEQAGKAETRLAAELDALLDACRRHAVALIVVSNEVGQGVVPPYPLGRQYRDLLGRANQRLAGEADAALYFVAGQPLDLKALGAQALLRLDAVLAGAPASHPREDELRDCFASLATTRLASSGRIIDLTQRLEPAAPVWPGDPPVDLTPWADIAREGFWLQRFCAGEHSGTHIGVAAHLQAGGLTADRLPAERLLAPACVIDFRLAAAHDPDATLTPADVELWEQAHGRVPAGSVVLLCTGWDTRWARPAEYLNPDAAGALHFPGFSPAAVDLLAEGRQVAGLGTDTAGIDAGADSSFEANHRLLRGERFHLENLANLHLLPPTGAWLFIGALPLAGGGAPARVLALVPA